MMILICSSTIWTMMKALRRQQMQMQMQMQAKVLMPAWRRLFNRWDSS